MRYLPLNLVLLTAAACTSFRPVQEWNRQIPPSREIRVTFAVPTPFAFGCDVVEQPAPDSSCASDSLPEPGLRELQGTLRSLHGDTMFVRVESVRNQSGKSEHLQPPRWARVPRGSAIVEERRTNVTGTVLLVGVALGLVALLVAAASEPQSPPTKPMH